MRAAFRFAAPLIGAIAFIGACADLDVPSTTPTRTPSATGTASATAVPSASPIPSATSTPGAPTSTATVLPPSPSPSPSPTTAPPTSTAAPTVPPGRAEQLAPIEAVEVFGDGSGNATARITSGLPSGCAVYSRAEVTRTANGARVTVYNHLPVGNVACTMIYGYTTHDVALGGGFTAGRTYTIEVNDTSQLFTPR